MKLWALVRTRGVTDIVAFLVTAFAVAPLEVLTFAAAAATIVSPGIGPAASIGLPAYLFALCLVALGRWVTQSRISGWFAGVAASIRGALLARANRIEPAAWEKLDTAELRHGLSTLPVRLSDIAGNIAGTADHVFQATVLCGALFWLYWPIGVAAVATYLVLGVYVSRLAHEIGADEVLARQADEGLHRGVAELIHGRKELLLDPRKADLLFTEAIDGGLQSRAAAREPVRRHLLIYMILVRALEPIMVGASILSVVLVPHAGTGGPDELIALLLIYAMPFTIFQVAPQILSGEATAAQLETLEASLDTAARAEGPPRAPPPVGDRFETLELRDATYRYADGRNRFRVGPLSLKIEPGTITFISGENGGGKSTLVKLLTGLYTPRLGAARLNGEVVELRDHRSLFSLILSDHTIFDRLYGLGAVDPARVNALLDKFGVAHATRYEDGRFTRIELSSGQKKRVGLVAALLEDKPILVLDEWAAEQDPEMRARYYLEILPELKAAGKAIVAVTHDDRYLHECDQLVLMRDGRIRYAGPPLGAAGAHAEVVA